MPHSSDIEARRRFLIRVLQLGGASAATIGLGAFLSGRSARPEELEVREGGRDHRVAASPTLPELVVAQGESPQALVQRALLDIGGMGRFVARGETVVVKPNIAWDRSPEQAATTHPEVVAEVVRQCLAAGARSVIVTDVSCNDAQTCFERSGIAAAAKAAGAEVVLPEPRFFRQVDLKGGTLGVWPVLEPFLEAHKLINVPIAKHHSLTGVTLGMKNWYGLIGGNRSRLHQRIHESLVDLTAFARPTLTVMDAYRVLMRNGPTGGDVEDVELKKTILVSTDPVALDAYAAKAWWDLDAPRLRYLRLAEERGLGRTDFASLRTHVLTV
ncbi:MAG: DUF362 domain-containing protein [Acidobacteria bacterium]|nr:DUF362 domain-containing protein [Acidobacteriota bacterium]